MLVLFVSTDCTKCNYIKSKLQFDYLELPATILKGGVSDWKDYNLPEVLAELEAKDWCNQLPVAFDTVTKCYLLYDEICLQEGITPMPECDGDVCQI